MIRGRGRAARETGLGGVGEESKGVKDDGGGGFDLRLREAAEGNVLYGGDAGKTFLLEAGVLEAVERHHQGERRRRSNQKREGEGGAGNGGAEGRRRGGERRRRWEQEAR
ncbi:hypothetical protein U1Q18_013976 [Sarracenia purpurea var. burkii]